MECYSNKNEEICRSTEEATFFCEITSEINVLQKMVHYERIISESLINVLKRTLSFHE